MAKHVDDKELIERAEHAIKQNARHDDFPCATSMCNNLTKDTFGESEDSEMVGYYLLDRFGITPRAICHFLRKVEKDYPSRDVNPYHNNIHASDVIQTTHALIQFGGEDLAFAYSSMEIFTILIAAALHDVRHPGTNNTYQVNKQTDLAVVYNDQSVLENMHASRASHLLKESGGDDEDNSEGIFGKLSKKNRVTVRTGIIRAILSTDMSHHFKSVAKMEGYIADLKVTESSSSILAHINKSEHSKLREKLLPFILHLADISNPTKSPDVSIEWSNSAYDEFFLQGDKEAKEGMPISPLCDRSTTNPPDGQIGFISYVVKPAFVVLQQCLPEVHEVLTQVRVTMSTYSSPFQLLATLICYALDII